MYSTCTICKKENELNMKYLLGKGNFEAIDIKEYLPENLRKFANEGYIQLLPGVNNTDGFFISAMRKKGF